MSLDLKFKILFYPQVTKEDLPRLKKTDLERIKIAINKKLRTSPEVFGKPLRSSLKGFRSLRFGDYRIIFQIQKKEIHITTISHRSLVYKIGLERLN